MYKLDRGILCLMGRLMDYNAWGNCQLTREQTLGLYVTTNVALWASGRLKSLFLPVNCIFFLAYLFIYLNKFLAYPSASIFNQLYIEGVHCRHYAYKLDVELSKLKSIITSIPDFLSINRIELTNVRNDLIRIITDIYNIYSSLYLYTNHGQKSLTRDQTKLYTLLKLALKGLGNIPCIIKYKGDICNKVANIDVYDDINSYTNIQVNNLCKIFKCDGVPYLEPENNLPLVDGNDLKLNFLSMFYLENYSLTNFVNATYKGGYLMFDSDCNESDDVVPLRNHFEWVSKVLVLAREVLSSYFEFSSLTPMHIIKGLTIGQFDMLLGSNKMLKYESIMRLKCKIEKIITEDSEIDSLFFPSKTLIDSGTSKRKSVVFLNTRSRFFRPVPKFNLPNDLRWLNIISLMFGTDVYTNIYVDRYYKSEKMMLFFLPNAVYFENLIIYNDTNRFYYNSGYSMWSYNYAGVGESVGFATIKQSKKDACNIVKHIISGIDDGFLVLAGRSIGGSACAAAAATIRDSKIKAAIFDRTFGDIHGLARELYGKWLDIIISIYPIIGPCPIQYYISVDRMGKLLKLEPYDELVLLPFSLSSNVASVLVQAFEIYKDKGVLELWEQGTGYSDMIATNYSRLLMEMPKEIEFISQGLNACGCTFFDIYNIYYRTPMLYKLALSAFVSLGSIYGSVHPMSTGYKIDDDKYDYFKSQLIEYLNGLKKVDCGDMLPVDRQLVVDMMLLVGAVIYEPDFYIVDDMIFLDINSIKFIDRDGSVKNPVVLNPDSDVFNVVETPDIWPGRVNKFLEVVEGFEMDIGYVSFNKFSAWMRFWWRFQIMGARKVLKNIAGSSGKPKCNTAANVLYTFFDELLVVGSYTPFNSDELKRLDNFEFKDISNLDAKRGILLPINCGHNGNHSLKEDQMLALYLSESTKG